METNDKKEIDICNQFLSELNDKAKHDTQLISSGDPNIDYVNFYCKFLEEITIARIVALISALSNNSDTYMLLHIKEEVNEYIKLYQPKLDKVSPTLPYKNAAYFADKGTKCYIDFYYKDIHSYDGKLPQYESELKDLDKKSYILISKKTREKRQEILDKITYVNKKVLSLQNKYYEYSEKKRQLEEEYSYMKRPYYYEIYLLCKNIAKKIDLYIEKCKKQTINPPYFSKEICNKIHRAYNNKKYFEQISNDEFREILNLQSDQVLVPMYRKNTVVQCIYKILYLRLEQHESPQVAKDWKKEIPEGEIKKGLDKNTSTNKMFEIKDEEGEFAINLATLLNVKLK